MRAIHLPRVPEGEKPLYSFPTRPAPPSVLEYSTSFPDPTPPNSLKTHAYLISVTATALTRGELTWAEILDPARFHPHGGAVPGHDVVGIVHTVYPVNAATAITKPRFKIGDKICGLLDFDRDGAAAEHAIAYENELAFLPEAPPNTPQGQWETRLATLPLSALTAYQSLFDHANISPELLTTNLPTITQTTSNSNATRPSVLILGPTGSVGLPTLYLSLAAWLNTTVLTSCRHLEFLRTIGQQFAKAESTSLHVITRDTPDYVDLPTAFTAHSPPIPPVDLMIDTVGGQTLQDLLLSPVLNNVIRPSGKVVTLAAPVSAFGADVEKKINENCKKCGVEIDFFIVRPEGSQLSKLGELATQGKLVGHVDAVFPLEKGREAMEMVEGKRGVGKVVLRVTK